MKRDQKKKMVILSIATMMMVVSFSSFSFGLDILSTENERSYTHTVLAEQKTATWCPHCPPVSTIMENIWESYEYDFNLISLVNDKNTYAAQRNSELGSQGFPTVYYDGGYIVRTGSGWAQSVHEAAIDTCGARSVSDIEIDLDVLWLGDNELDISITVVNHEDSTYQADIRVYVTENYSRWSVEGKQYRFAFIGNYAVNEQVSINAGEHWIQQTIWNGNNWGFNDLSADNLRVIAAVFDQTTGYTDESVGMEPLTNLMPTADFEWDIDHPTVDDTIQFIDLSTDPDGEIVAWEWDFGDGNSSYQQHPSHSYLENGVYSVSLNVEDDDGAIDTISKNVIVSLSGLISDSVQTLSDRGFRFMPGWDAAQEFIPSYPVLSRVELYMTTWNNPAYPIPVEIRKDDPMGDVLFSGVIYPADVTASFPEWGWVSVDIGVAVDVGETYVIVLRDSADDDFNHLMWGVYTSFGIPGPYPDGNMLFRKLGFPTWMPIWDFDCAFITYFDQ